MYQLPGYQDIMIPGASYFLQNGSIFGPVAGHPLSSTDFSDMDIELAPHSPVLVRGRIVFKKDQSNLTVVSYTHDETICATISQGIEFGTRDNVSVRHGVNGTKPWHLFDHHEHKFIPALGSQIHVHHVYGSKEYLFFDEPTTDVFVHCHSQDALGYSVSSTPSSNFTVNIMTQDPVKILLSSGYPNGSSVTALQDRNIRVIVESNMTVYVQEGAPTLWLDTRQTSVVIGLPFQHLVHKIAEYLLKDMDAVFARAICEGFILERGYLVGLSLQDDYEERLFVFLSENRSDIRSLIQEMQPSVNFPEKTLDLVQHIHDTCSKYINPKFLRPSISSEFFPFEEFPESPQSPRPDSTDTPPNSTSTALGSKSPEPNSKPSEASQKNATETTDPSDTSATPPPNDADSNNSSLTPTHNIKDDTESSSQCLYCCTYHLFAAVFPWIAIQFT
jgi:hypothetical protein